MTDNPLLRGLAAVTIALALITAACGGDKDDAKDDSAAAEASGTAATPTPAATRASPSRTAATVVPADGAAIVVANPVTKVQYVPTLDELRGMEQTSVKGQSGVSFATLATKAGITEPKIVTIDGINPANNAFASTRYPFADVASTTILVLDDRGHLSMVSDTVPDGELLIEVSSIVLE